MMQLKLSIIAGAFSLLVVIFAACGWPTATSTTVETESLEDILSQAANVTLVTYDCVFTWPERTQTSKVWVKNSRMRVDTSHGQTVQTYLLDMEEATVNMWRSPENIPQELGIATGEVSDFVSAMAMARGFAN